LDLQVVGVIMTASLQFSIDERRYPTDEQSTTVFHTPPATIDNWGQFVSTSTVPGNWVGNTFYYGNSLVVRPSPSTPGTPPADDLLPGRQPVLHQQRLRDLHA
jgi:hypothetical protein